MKAVGETDVQERRAKRILEIERRLDNLDKLLIKLYEDMYSGGVQEESGHRMQEKFQAEMAALTREKAELQRSQLTEKETKAAYDNFFALTERYSEIKELNTEIIATFIDRIEVEPKVYPPGVKVYARSKIPYKQTIHIYYKFIGDRLETIDIKPA